MLCGWLTLAQAQDLPAPLEVKPGDTASQLAMAHLPQGVTLDQMLVALLQANPKAFIDGNVNLLKAGVTLKLPTAAQAQQLPPDQARQAVIEQTRRFIRHATRMADTVATTGAREKAREMSGKVAPDDSPAERAQPEQDKLVLSKPSVAASSPEARIATERQTQESRSQLGLLQQNLKDLQALVKPGEAKTSAPAASASSPSATAPRAGLLKKFPSVSTTTLAIGAGVLALLGLLLFVLLRSRSEENPSEDDEDAFWVEPVAAPSPARTPSLAETRGLAQMASIDLNLDPEPPRSTPGLPR
jgi:pilus assembly protein FimV